MPMTYGRPDTTRTDPFFRSGRYTPPDTSWATTPGISGPSGYLEQNPDAHETRYLAQKLGLGLNDQTPWGQYVRDKMREARLGYQAALADDPTLTYGAYLGGLNPNLIRRDFLRQGPRLRGEYNALFGGPMRTIADL